MWSWRALTEQTARDQHGAPFPAWFRIILSLDPEYKLTFERTIDVFWRTLITNTAKIDDAVSRTQYTARDGVQHAFKSWLADKVALHLLHVGEAPKVILEALKRLQEWDLDGLVSLSMSASSHISDTAEP